MAEAERHAIVVGAGLAGAAVCAELTRKGWSVALVDASAGPAGGASGLPVGMLSPHVTRAPTPLSRLTHWGVASTMAELQRLVRQGHGWRSCEVDNLNHDEGRWQAALVRPGALIDAWLQEAKSTRQLECHWNQRVVSLSRCWLGAGVSGWAVQTDRWAQPLQAPVVVLCAAFGSLALLSGLADAGLSDAFPLRPVKGQMSLAALEHDPLAERPQRDDGVFVPCYDDAGLSPTWPHRIWAMGSTYTRGDASTNVTPEDHWRNLQSLQRIHPGAAAAFQRAQENNSLMGWSQVRCASLDRLPLVGAVPDLPALGMLLRQRAAGQFRLPLGDIPRQPGLFILSALGSRGITLAHWCARLLVTHMNRESPPDTEANALEVLDPARFIGRQLRRLGGAAIKR